MTVSSTTRKAGPFLGNDVTTAFPFTFKLFDTADLELTLVDSNGDETALTLDSDYSIALNADQDNNPGGTITYPLSGDPLPTGSQMYGLDVTPTRQSTDLTNLGRFLPQVIENAFDRLTIIAQQLKERMGRAMVFSPLDTDAPQALPVAANRLDRVLGFHSASGQPQVSTFTMTEVSSAIAAAYAGAAGPLDALSFLQAGAGAVSRTAQDKARDRYNVFDVMTAAEKADALSGAPATDTTAKIQAAIDAALAAGKVCEAYGTFKTTSKIVFKGDCNFAAATFNCTGIGTGVAAEVSTGSAANPTDVLFRKVMQLPRLLNMDKPGVGWAGQGTGLRTVNANSCRILCPYIAGFAVGHLDTSYSQGNVYNEIVVLHYDNNKVNHLLQPGNATGWVNENLYLGGRYAHNTGEGANVAGARHIAIRLGTAGWEVPNNNVFFKPSIEGDTPQYHLEIEGGVDNDIYNARWEATTPKVLLDSTNGAVTRNSISRGYGSHSIVVTKTGASVSENRLETQMGLFQQFVGITQRTGLNFSHRTSDADYGCITMWPSTVDPLTLNGTETSWTLRLSNTQLHAKLTGSAYDQVRIDRFRIKYGPGTHDPVISVQADASDNLLIVNDGGGSGYLQHFSQVTAAQLLDKTHAVNTKNKVGGRSAWVTASARMVYAGSGADTGGWYYADGTLAYTPV